MSCCMPRTLLFVLLVAAALVDAACMEPEETLSGPAESEMVGVPAVQGEQPRGVYVMTSQVLDEAPPSPPDYMYAGATIFYMNRHGGTYTPGYNDSRTNRSTIPSFTATIAPWGVSDAGWNQVMDCVKDIWSPFNVIITDVDPGDVPHFESVVAGYPGDVGMGSGVGGVSPFTYDCSVIPNSIVFTFAEVYGTNYQAVCETVAQEVAHSFGLDHEYMCQDPMTYLGGCGSKSFQNTNAPCGEYSARTCACGGSTQNSVAMLSARIGTADATPPTVAITAPANGATVEPGFSVTATATDDSGAVYSVELYIDGGLVDTKTAPPYTFTTGTLADGQHTIATVASDGINEATAQIQVTVQTPGTDPDPDPDPGDVDPPDPDSPDPGDVDPGNPDPGDPDPGDPDGPTYSGDLNGGCNAAGGAAGGPGAFALLFWLLTSGRRRKRDE